MRLNKSLISFPRGPHSPPSANNRERFFQPPAGGFSRKSSRNVLTSLKWGPMVTSSWTMSSRQTTSKWPDAQTHIHTVREPNGHDFTNVHVADGRGLVLLCRHYVMYYWFYGWNHVFIHWPYAAPHVFLSGNNIQQHNGRDFSQVLLNDKDPQLPIVSCRPRGSLLPTINLAYKCIMTINRQCIITIMIRVDAAPVSAYDTVIYIFCYG